MGPKEGTDFLHHFHCFHAALEEPGKMSNIET